ncbi:protein CrcB homolog [Gordonia hirsuta DSM 44140 = NBRC 16056]|uniref:Fluoride-specific ion channel FluC n=1 Tax=Gordonia hirsuta DSM 44140 = NBRC 16056 TaxID=1121927 RepID=L7L832_9ACTN|nr:CrcB family protein [Gordonia hirsuta]GAC57064.1 protein CrcB homolog [Gordonia hirsuta DSM 44140 = NBRC 16056]
MSGSTPQRRGLQALAGQGPAMLLVLAGGMLGAPARYGVESVLPSDPGGFPVGTFAVNIVGSAVLGLLLETLLLAGPDTGARNRLRLLWGTGFLGAFTTYSSFAVELDALGRGGHAVLAAGYAAASLAGGLAAVGIGIGAAQRIRRWRGAQR